MKTSKHKWDFAARFRRNTFGWRSQPAMNRIKEAVSEIKKAARTNPVLGAEGAVLLLEKVSPALSHVDSSSGAIGAAVNNAIDELVPIIAKAPADDKLRRLWLERLWKAIEEDDIPYIEYLIDYWGDLCAVPEIASRWADELIGTVRMALNPDPALRGYFKGTTACLSALLKAGRNEDILALLELEPSKWWHDRQWGVKALVAMGKKSEALQYAENSRGLNVSPISIARACEEILLSSGMAEEAYNRYGIGANQKTTYLATFREIFKKYPYKNAKDILNDLVESTPGNEGKWFAAARSAGLYTEAIELANSTPCDPRTLDRAARDMAAAEPRFAVEAGMVALKWLAEGYGYDVTSLDVRDVYKHTMEAARNGGCESETLERIRLLLEKRRPENGL
jgi:hypothetical protein